MFARIADAKQQVRSAGRSDTQPPPMNCIRLFVTMCPPSYVNSQEVGRNNRALWADTPHPPSLFRSRSTEVRSCGCRRQYDKPLTFAAFQKQCCSMHCMNSGRSVRAALGCSKVQRQDHKYINMRPLSTKHERRGLTMRCRLYATRARHERSFALMYARNARPRPAT